MNRYQLSPTFLLLSGLVLTGFLIWIFWPKAGLFALISKATKANRKSLIEDTLKILYDRAYKSVQSDIPSLAGSINITVNKAAKILHGLEKQGLVNITGQKINLTDAGISGALRIIRAHRILEKYFAEETGLSAGEWHPEADLQEHQVSYERIGEIYKKLGNPVYDPHGDPIPTADGELPVHKGQSLSEVIGKGIFTVIRIDDKPGYIYDQIAAFGIYPGMQLIVLNIEKDRTTVIVNGTELVLTRLFASSIIVEESEPLKENELKYDILSSLKIGEDAEIAGISPLCRGQQRRRLMDMGVVPGSRVVAEIKSASGDPVGYRIMGATIGIRKKQADLIFINKNKILNNE